MWTITALALLALIICTSVLICVMRFVFYLTRLGHEVVSSLVPT